MSTQKKYSSYEDLLASVEHYLPNLYNKEQTKIYELFKNPQFLSLFDNAPSIIIVLNSQTMHFEYFSKNVKDILGYEAQRYLKEGMVFSMSTMDPDHLVIHNKYVYPDMLKYLSEYASKGETRNLKFSTSFKVKKADGNYIWAMQQLTTLETDENGYPLLSLLFMNDISDIKKDNCVDLVIRYKGFEGVYTPLYAASYADSDNVMLFSKRELEVLHCINEGMSSKSIAEKLFISLHTVHNHRKSMLRKTQTKNTPELLKFSNGKGLL